MKTFKEFLIESSARIGGNYVSFDVERPKFVDAIDPHTGQVSKQFHVTVIYSNDTDMDPEMVLKNVVRFRQMGFVAKVVSAEVFDSQDDQSTGCVVLKLDCDQLHATHSSLVNMGLRHSYASFEPHVTLWYGVALDEANSIKSYINKLLKQEETTIFIPNKIKSEKIQEDWNKS